MVVNAKSAKIVYGTIPQAKNTAEPLLTAIGRYCSLLGLAEASVVCFRRMMTVKSGHAEEFEGVCVSLVSVECRMHGGSPMCYNVTIV